LPAIKAALVSLAKPSPNPVVDQQADADADAPLELVSWSYHFQQGHYSFEHKHCFSYVLKNRSNKSIKLVEGTLRFTDLPGEQLILLRVMPDVHYPANTSTSATGIWDYNQFDGEQARLTSMNHDDIKATLIIQKVLFLDGTVWTANGS
jgi:hypothetical protein